MRDRRLWLEFEPVRQVGVYDADAVSELSGLACPLEEGKAEQSFKEECDINEIVRRFGLTGQMPESVAMPRSGDFEEVSDYKSAMDVVARAQSEFNGLPAALRARFENDPGRLLRFLEEPKNLEEARSLGLVNPAPVVPRDTVAAIDELAAKLAVPEAGAKTKP